MQSHCPHCDTLIDVPDRQTDVLCPNCHRFFLWTPGEEETVRSEEGGVRSDAKRSSEQEARSEKREARDAECSLEGIDSNNSTPHSSLLTPNYSQPESDSADEEPIRPNSVGLYKNNTPKMVQEPEHKHHIRRRVPKTGKNMYPYELPGQVVEADRRMPVYSSMMYDAYTILKYNVGTMFVAMFFYTIFMAILVVCCGALYWGIAEVAEALSKENPVTFKLIVFTSLLFFSTFGYTWIMNGQRLYVIELIRRGQTNTSFLFSGRFGFFRNFFVLLIHLAPLILPLSVGYCYYIWSYYQGNAQKIEESLGVFYYVYQQTPIPVGIAVAIMGIGIFLIIVLNWGLAFWLVLDKDLGLFEALDVSHKITREKKATFLGIMCSSNGLLTIVSMFTAGVFIVLYPIALIFVGMYYMKTAIQEMVIPGKTDLGARISLYGDDGELSDHYDDEEDIL